MITPVLYLKPQPYRMAMATDYTAGQLSTATIQTWPGCAGCISRWPFLSLCLWQLMPLSRQHGLIPVLVHQSLLLTKGPHCSDGTGHCVWGGKYRIRIGWNRNKMNDLYDMSMSGFLIGINNYGSARCLSFCLALSSEFSLCFLSVKHCSSDIAHKNSLPFPVLRSARGTLPYGRSPTSHVFIVSGLKCRPLNYLSFRSDHLIYLGLLQWIYCLVFFQA